MSSVNPPFKPSFGGKLLVIGCSDKGPRDIKRNGGTDGPKVTTTQRANAALEQYWHQRSAGGSQAGDSIPGGENLIAQRTREACWHDSVHLDHVSYQAEQAQAAAGATATVAEIEEKERTRTRGIPGFTGRQPPPGQSRPPLPAPDTSGWVAVNAFDERRPRVKGIPGYTGHQPPAGLRSTSPQAAGNRQQLCLVPHADHQSDAALPQCSCSPAKQQVVHLPTCERCISRNCMTAANYTDQQQQQQLCQQADCHKQRLDSAAAAAAAAQAPRFFINGVELPADALPSTAASDTTAASHRSVAVWVPPASAATAQPAAASAAVAGPALPGGAASHNAKNSPAVQAAVSDSCDMMRPFTSPGDLEVRCAHSFQPVMPMLPEPAIHTQVAQRINRPTTYASSFHPAALQHMRRLQISGRPASAADLSAQQVCGDNMVGCGRRPHN